MAHGHQDNHRQDRRAFRPSIDGRLETRVLMARMPSVLTQTAAGGQAVVVTNTDGQQFFVSVTEGTIRGFAAPGGRVSFVADGTTVNTQLEINQILPKRSSKSGAHTFNSNLSNQTGFLNVAAITVTSGSINAIEGYRDAVLSGPISVGASTPISRIAFASIMPGASIGVGGDLNTLEVLNNATFSNSTGLYVGRDLNWLSVNGNLTFNNGANMIVNRDLGQTFQQAKGSGTPGQGLFVNGNFTIGATSHVSIARNIPFGVLINGNLSGFSRWNVSGVPLTTYLANRINNGFAPNVQVVGQATP